MRAINSLSALTFAGLMALMIVSTHGLAASPKSKSLPHFTFAAPEDGRWSEEGPPNPQSFVYGARRGTARYRIVVLENTLVDEKMKTATAKEVADDYRLGEKNNMIEQGVRPGLYELLDVEMGQESLGGKLYFTMKYSTRSKAHYERARLYLYFPSESQNQYFLVAHYSEVAPNQRGLNVSLDTAFAGVLETIAHRPGEQGTTSKPADSWDDFLSDFRNVHSFTQTPLTPADLKIHCQKKVDDTYVTFVKSKKEGIFLAVITGWKFSRPEKNLFTSAPPTGIPKGGTRDWGYVFDRNHDGKVDYLAFLDGPNPVVPDDWVGELPQLGGQSTVEELREVVLPNIKLVFWHLVDDNFDDRHDGVAVSMRNVENMWIDGWVVARDSDFDGRYDECKSFQGVIHKELGPCEGAADDYRVANKRPSGLGRIPPGYGMLQFINAAASECKLTGNAFRALDH